MDEIQQKASFNQSSQEQANQFQNEFNRSITSIENLSNELFYEIFDYLDGCHIYQAFSNLNHHFQQLLNSSFLLFKINSCHSGPDVFINNFNQMICFNRQQIFSVNVYLPSRTDEFFSSLFIIDSSLNHLQSLVFHELEPDILISVLVKLTSLPRLFSLTIIMFNDVADLTNTYRLIFNLPMLKYCKLTTSGEDLPISLPIANNQQFSPIEYLVIDHGFTFNEVSAVTSYTPQLRHLKFAHDLNGNPKIGIISPNMLSNLTHLSIHAYNLTFNAFKIFIRKNHLKLKFLCVITQSQDITYLNANRWEKLILEYLPQLKNFRLEYDEYIDNDFVFPTYPGELNQFTSSFWIKRQWLLETEIDYEYIKYIIRPYKTRWYEYTENSIVNSSLELSKSTRLNIMDMPRIDSYELIIKYIKRILSIAQIYHLEISEGQTVIAILIRIINLLPDLHSVKIHSLSYDVSNNLYNEELNSIYSTLDTKKITKICVEQMILAGEIFMVMTLFHYVTYLKVNYIYIMDTESCLRNILEQINREYSKHLRLLCFRVPLADDEMMKTLQKTINDEKLLVDYTIKRVFDNIYLQWT